jgi:hypothetical protein
MEDMKLLKAILAEMNTNVKSNQEMPIGRPMEKFQKKLLLPIKKGCDQ